VRASTGGRTGIRGASVAIIAINGEVLATKGWVASIVRAIIACTANNGSVLATKSVAAGSLSASVGSIASLSHSVATGSSIAIRNIAFVSTASEGSMVASGRVGASVGSASITIVAIQSGVYATSGGIARINGANVSVIARSVSVGATDIGGNQNGTGSVKTGIVIGITRGDIGSSTTGLTVSIANTAPIVICALDGNRGSDLDFRQNGVSFAIEEIETVVVSFGEAHSIDFNASSKIGVNTTEIDHQLIVKENPHVIISLEIEELASLVSKTSMDVHAIGKIVEFTILSFSVIVPSYAIQREEIGLLVGVLSAGSSYKGQGNVV
jgi:hypothetical protein